MTKVTLELPEQELKLFLKLAAKLNAINITVQTHQKVESPLYWLEQLMLKNEKSSIQNPSEWQRETRER